MAKPDYFLLLDTETTQDSLVADFGAIVCNRKGEIMTQCAVMVLGVYNDMEKHPLFHLFGDDMDIWSKAGLPARYCKYNDMLASGARQYASNHAINRWLEAANAKYSPILTAYNLAFDTDKCNNTDIDLAIFSRRFCLMQAAQQKWSTSKKYLQFILDNHFFKNPTMLGNMSYSTTAETMARFIMGNPELSDEPHTALEDVIYYELPILQRLVKTTKKGQWLNPKTSGWQGRQVKDWYKPK